MTNKPAKMMPRISAALIDFLLIYVFVYAITFLITKTPLGTMYNEAYTTYNDLYNSYIVQMNLGSFVDSSGTSVISLITSYTSADVALFNSTVMADQVFIDSMNKALNIYFIINLIAITVVESIFLFVIPFFNKRGQTVGKIIMGLGVIDIRHDMFLDKKGKAIRFAGSFLIETVLLLFIFKNNNISMVTMFAPMIVLMMIMLSQNRQALHDLISHAKVVELKTATIFDSIEEKESYDAKYLTELEFNKSKEAPIEEKSEDDDEEPISDDDDPFMQECLPKVELIDNSVFINDYPEENLKKIVLELQDITNLSTIEAKRILDTLPALVKTGLTIEDANNIKDRLVALGVEVEIK